MRIAFVWNAPFSHPSLTSVYADYLRGMTELGCEVQFFYHAGASSIGCPFPVEVFDGEAMISNPAYWIGRGFDAGIIITWHRMAGVLQAMRTAGIKTVAIGDSDGQVSLRHNPWPTFRYRTYLQPTWRLKIGAAKQWFTQYLFGGRRIDEELIAATESADLFALPAPGCAMVFREFLRGRGATGAAARVVSVPYPVADSFCSIPVATVRDDRVIAVGRWDSPQKNGKLLAATVARLAAARPSTEFLIIGQGAEKAFAAVAERYRSVRLLGVQPRTRVRDLMADARILVISSRWEGSPVVANEMLALGGTVVGTPIPSLKSLFSDEAYGRVSNAHTAAALASALQAELADWDGGHRSPESIAIHWRGILNPVAVASSLLQLLSPTQNANTAQHAEVT